MNNSTSSHQHSAAAAQCRKFQTPTSKHQISSKFQGSTTKSEGLAAASRSSGIKDPQSAVDHPTSTIEHPHPVSGIEHPESCPPPPHHSGRACRAEVRPRRGAVLDRRTTWERLSQIDDWIASGAYPSCQSMALRLCVSVRTVTRDIEFLKTKRKLPIAYDPRRYGFYYTKPVRGFSKPPMTEAGIFAMLVAHKSIAQYHGTPFEKPLRLAFEKLTGQLDNRELHSVTNLGDALSFRPIAPEDFDTPLYRAISKAMGESRELLFRYRNGGDDRVTPRRVQPWHLVACDHRWYLVGYNVHQRCVRTYALSRMTDPRILKNKFLKPRDFDPNEHFKDCLGVMKGDGTRTYEVVVELDRFGTDLIRNRRWHSSQQLIDLPDGCSRLTVRLGCLDEIERTILSWGIHATVIAPAELRTRIATISQQLNQMYAPSHEN